MTQEEKQLLIKDICARLPYGVKADFKQGQLTRVKHEVEGWYIDEIKDDNVVFIKPYLRPMSSMTEEEAKQLNSILPCSMSFSYTTGEELIIYTDSEYDGDHYFGCFVDIEDWLNAHHFDFRNLISKGLALEAPKDMYKAE